MRMKARALLLSSVLMVTVSPAAQAAVITFEAGLDAAFSYAGVDPYSAGCGACFAGTGYQSVLDATASNGAVYNPFATSPSDFLWNGAGTFDLTSFVIAGAWGNQNLTVEGWNNGVLVQSAVVAITPTAAVFSPNWSGLDQLRILIDAAGYTDTVAGGDGQHWALDNLTINANRVPEPATLLLLGGGLAAVARRYRQRRA